MNYSFDVVSGGAHIALFPLTDFKLSENDQFVFNFPTSGDGYLRSISLPLAGSLMGFIKEIGHLHSELEAVSALLGDSSSGFLDAEKARLRVMREQLEYIATPAFMLAVSDYYRFLEQARQPASCSKCQD